MTNETPGKICSLLGAAVVSMFFLFAVSATNASFAKVENPMPDPFAPEKVMAVLDNVSASYNKFLATNLFRPVQNDLAFYQDNAKWVIDESSDSILAMTGLTDLASVQYYQNLDRAQQAPKVAGAYTDKNYSSGSLNINSIYSFLMR